MNRPILIAYLLLTGWTDILTAVVFLGAPDLTLQLMQLPAPRESMVLLSLVGAFVLAVGLSSLYGAYITFRGDRIARVEAVWLLTAFTRASVAIFISEKILTLNLGTGWLVVAVTESICVLIQAVGLRRGWLANVAR
jgi:hypothetical protein